MLTKSKMPVLTQDVVKIAVKTSLISDAIPQLIEFDQTQPLTAIIQNLCNRWAIVPFEAENYALQFDDTTPQYFVTEKNRKDVKNGTVLQLRASPMKTSKDILEKLRGSSDEQKIVALKELAALSSDMTFALEYIKEKGLAMLIDIIETGDWASTFLQYIMPAFVELTDHGTVSFDVLSEQFIQRNIEYIKNASMYQEKEIIIAALNILENIVQNGSKHHLIEKEFVYNSLESLLKILQESGTLATLLQNNTLALINALFVKGNDETKKKIAETFSKKQYRSVILDKVIGTNMSQELSHQLYIFQTLTLSLLEHRMRTSVTQHEQEVLENITKLKRIAFEADGNDGNMTSDAARLYNKKLGFKDNFNPMKDFMEIPPGFLALDCMLFFAMRYEHNYKKVVHENSIRQDDKNDCPFARTSIELIKVLLDVLKIGNVPNESGGDFQPIFFAHDQPFEELYCACVIVLNKTWKDMRATVEDFAKVLSIVREQITRTLAMHPRTMDEFTTQISRFSYQTITKLRQQERESREEVESTAPAIVNLKEKLMPEILALIKQQRLQYMQAGSKFQKQVGRAKKTCYLRLSPNFKFLHISENDDKSNQIPALEEMKEKHPVSDIRQLLTGKDCPNAKARKQALAFAINVDSEDSYDSMNNKTLEFIAPDEQCYNYFCDGLNALLNQPMESPSAKEELDILLSMRIKIQLLDTEGIDISKEPPPVPPEPDNYDFCFES
ncbi:engulfment and cell motility protein 1 [Culicoides brevitarsis]|uniref:engulfment and cell motility protein 1 n=1 Tax=Culicoides brevitarsis TaxID=469753 RepID=UPI00307CAF27